VLSWSAFTTQRETSKSLRPGFGGFCATDVRRTAICVVRDELVGVADIFFQFRERLALADNTRNFFQPANVPAVVDPVLENGVYFDPPIACSSVKRMKR
jgi:hypothetical protein